MLSQLILYLLVAVSTVASTLPPCTKCPAGGFWSNWKDYTSCSDTCGLNGQKVQTRTCTSWSKGCPCSGFASRVRPCAPAACVAPRAACKSPYTQYTNSATGKKLCGNVSRTDNYVAPKCALTKVFNTCPCPAAGLWTEWSNVGSCNATCGRCGTVKQTRTCRSSSYGCPCPGAKTQNVHCEKAPCAGNTCCNGNKVVKILGTNPVEYQCGMLLPPYELLPLPTCPKTTTKATTKATTKTTTKATTTTKTTTKATTTTAKNCNSCTLAELNALNGNGDGFYTQGDILVDGVSGCNICGWSCNTTTSMVNYKVLGTDMSTVIVDDSTHCGYINNDNDGRYQCSDTGVWQFKTSAGVSTDMGKYTCSKGVPCCQSCTLAQLNALNGNGDGFYTQGGVIVDGISNCNICGWSCNTTTSMVNYQVLGTDLTTVVANDDTHCGYINNDNDGRYQCSSNGAWQFMTAAGVYTDMGKYTCSKGAAC
ncbi:unnamed protein product, partial [Mesorhabditis belari]|uniref:Uncharacterized protein n=1 Tax=Mesorhabditis belari TaxID=2138241 RepID=A0AAF3EKV1_9BILA